MSKDLQKLEREKIKAKNLKNFKEAAELCNYKGEIYSSSGDHEEALKEHKEELEFCKLSDDVLGKAIAYRRIGECYAELQKFDKALVKHTYFLRYAEEAGSLVEVQRAWATLGRTYFLQYNADVDRNPVTIRKAEEASLKALKFAENLRSSIKVEECSQMVCRACLNVAHVYECKNDKRCVSYYEKALLLAKKHGFKEDLHRCQISLGNFYQSSEKHVQAVKVFDDAIDTAKALKDKIKLCDAYISKAQSLLATSDYIGARYCFKKAFFVNSPAKEDHVRAGKCSKLLSAVLRLLRELNAAAENEEKLTLCDQIADKFVELKCFEAAIQYYRKELDYAKKLSKSNTELATIHVSLGQTFLDSKQYMSALEHFQEEQKLRKGNVKEVVHSAMKIIEIKIALDTNSEEVKADYREILQRCGSDLRLKKMVLMDYVLYLKEIDSEEADAVEEIVEGLQSIRTATDQNGSYDEKDDDGDLSAPSPLSSDSESDAEEKLAGGRRRRRVALRKNEKGETALHKACIEGNFEQVKQLVQKGHAVNERDNCGWLPIHEAANHGFANIVEYLIDHGAHMNDSGGKHCEGITPLHDACINGNFDVVRILVAKGANVTCRDHAGKTALDHLNSYKSRSDLSAEEDTQFLEVSSKLVEAMKLVNFDFSSQRRFSQKRPSNVPFTRVVKRNRHIVEDAVCLSGSDTDSVLDADECPYVSEYANAIDKLRRKHNVSKAPTKDALQETEYTGALLDENEIPYDDWLDDDVRRIRTARNNASDRQRRKAHRSTAMEASNFSCRNPSAVVSDPADEVREESTPELTGVESPDLIMETIADSDLMVDCSSNNCREENLGSKTATESKKENSLVRVHIEGDVFLINVPGKNSTVGWLAESTAQRYYSLKQLKPKISIRTKDNALLCESDLIADVVVESDGFMVHAVIDSIVTQSLTKRYLDQCQFANVPSSDFLVQKLRDSDETGRLELSSANIDRNQVKLLIGALKCQEALRNVNIAYSNLLFIDSRNELLKTLVELPQIQTLDLQGTGLTLFKLRVMSSLKSNLNKLDLSYNFLEGLDEPTVRSILSNKPLLADLNLRFSDVSTESLSEVLRASASSKVVISL